MPVPLLTPGLCQIWPREVEKCLFSREEQLSRERKALLLAKLAREEKRSAFLSTKLEKEFSLLLNPANLASCACLVQLPESA